jgi:hypothetical protein
LFSGYPASRSISLQQVHTISGALCHGKRDWRVPAIAREKELQYRQKKNRERSFPVLCHIHMHITYETAAISYAMLICQMKMGTE